MRLGPVAKYPAHGNSPPTGLDAIQQDVTSTNPATQGGSENLRGLVATLCLKG